jgi:cysteine desulfurase
MAVYLDCAATTPLDPRVREVVLRFLDEDFGNAGSRTHEYGQRARRAVEQARQQVASVVGASRGDVIFTSGATEANNLAILGVAGSTPHPSPLPASGARGPGHIVTTAIEHHAVLEPVRELERRGFEVTIVQPDAGGRVDAAAMRAAIRPDTLLVSMMHVNNETGVIQPVAELASLVERDGLACALHVDAAQGFGKDLAPLRHPRLDFISISGHKIGAPKGVGALVARRRGRTEAANTPSTTQGASANERGDRPALAPLTFGGGQERGLRPGTLAVPLVAGLGLAAELAAAECDSRQARCRAFREQLIAGLAPLKPVVNGDPAMTVSNILNLTIPGIESDAAIEAWAELVAISNGAACTSQSYTCSHVLSAMGIGARRAEGALRFSWSHDSTMPDVAAMVDAIEMMRAAGNRGAAATPRVQVA